MSQAPTRCSAVRAGRRVPTDGHPNDNYQEADDNYQEVDDNYQEVDDNYNDNYIVTDETGGRTMMELVSAGHAARA
jgi:hypothetical protein